ncbi:MAG: hypothetical protein Q8N84_03810 [bacterium]|nr:hypothetical protein [bacterium]
MKGYVLITYQSNPAIPPAILNPWDKSQRIAANLRNFPGETTGIQAFIIKSAWQLRRYPLQDLIKMAVDGDKDGEVIPLAIQDVLARGLRPMDLVDYEVHQGVVHVTAVDGSRSPAFALQRPHYAELRMEKGDPFHREPIERIDELGNKPPEGMSEPQLRLVRKACILAARILAYLSPFVRGGATLIEGQAASGKSTIMRMFLYYVRWILLPEDSKVRVIVLAARERPNEFGEYQRMCRGTDRMELFGTTREDNPPTKTYWTAYCAMERMYRLMEQGYDVVLVIDALTRIAEAISLMASNDTSRITSGHSPAAILEPDAFLGASGILANGASGTVVGTAFSGTRVPWLDFPTEIWKGACDHIIGLETRAHAFPRLNVLDDEKNSTRNWEHMDVTEDERWFAEELRARMIAHGKVVGDRDDPDKRLQFLIDTFKETPQVVMASWLCQRRCNELVSRLSMTHFAAQVLVNKWDLTMDQVKKLISLGLGDGKVIIEIDQAGITPEEIFDLLEGRKSLEQIMIIVEQWSGQAYLKVLQASKEGKERQGSLAPATLRPLRDAGISAAQLGQLLGVGFEFSAIKKAAVDGATAETIMAVLNEKAKA